jgi:H/ACA ribonucleoprotein complex subunit 4
MTPAAGFIVNLDKPPGPSSHEVTAWVKRILKAGRAGHSGTLDPNVTGVLPIAVGRAVKLVQVMQKSDKEYVGVMKFEKEPNIAELKKLFKEFTGKIYQTPPKESAVKRVLRARKVHSLELLETDRNFALFQVKCQHGTYIRVLCEDIGEVMGNGAKMVELRRTRSGSFKEEDSVTLQELTDAVHMGKLETVVTPMEKGAEGMKKIVVKDSAVDAVCHGAKLAKPGVENMDGEIVRDELVALMTKKGELVALAKVMDNSKNMEKMKKGFVANTYKVIMSPGTYRKGWKHEE